MRSRNLLQLDKEKNRRKKRKKNYWKNTRVSPRTLGRQEFLEKGKSKTYNWASQRTGASNSKAQGVKVFIFFLSFSPHCPRTSLLFLSMFLLYSSPSIFKGCFFYLNMAILVLTFHILINLALKFQMKICLA